MPRATGTMQGFAKVEERLRQEVADIDAAIAGIQERREAVLGQLEELLRVKEMVSAEMGAPARKRAPARRKKARRRASASAAPAAPVALPEEGTSLRAVLDATRGGVGEPKEISAQTGIDVRGVGSILATLRRRGLATKAGPRQYEPGPALAEVSE